MKVTSSLTALVRATTGLLVLGAVDCGGKAADESRLEPGYGGNMSAGGSSTTSNLGGSTTTNPTEQGGATSRTASGGSAAVGGAAIVAPRVPSVHRDTSASCVGVHSPSEPSASRNVSMSTCAVHADCTAAVNGRCVAGMGMGWASYSCVYDLCATDEDCPVSKVCYCTSTSAARCLSVGNCRTDGDCGGGPFSYCSPSTGFDCGGYRPIDGYHCHTAKDSCLDDSDCAGGEFCNFDVYENRWKCTAGSVTCVIG